MIFCYVAILCSSRGKRSFYKCTFPNVVFAGMFGFNRMEKFEAAAGAEKAPELNFNE